MRVLVTGAAGFVGSHLLHHLRAHDARSEIHGTTLDSAQVLREPDATGHVVNLLDADAVTETLRRVSPDHIYHLAASAVVHRSFDDPWATLENNIRAQLNVLQACVVLDIAPRILIVTSGEVYGVDQSNDMPTPETAPMRPANPYAVSKVTQDMLGLQYFLSAQLPTIRARPFNHLGPGQAPGFAAPDFARQIALIEAGQQEPVIRCGDLTAERDFTDVRDIVAAYRLLIERGVPGEAYNVSTGKTTSIRDVLSTLLGMAAVPISIRSATDHIRSSGVARSWGDPTRLRLATGWQPQVPLQQTLSDILNDWRVRVAHQQGEAAR
jgi:GDP-4-dehydro-6-deoxy-D-mannose reductase